jgi:hypothetical protein
LWPFPVGPISSVAHNSQVKQCFRSYQYSLNPDQHLGILRRKTKLQETPQSLERTEPNMKLLNFSPLFPHSWDPEPDLLTQLNPDLIWICFRTLIKSVLRIRIWDPVLF